MGTSGWSLLTPVFFFSEFSADVSGKMSVCCELKPVGHVSMQHPLCDRAQPLFCIPCFSETRVEDEEDLYDCVYGEDEGGEVYEDLMKAEEAQQPVGHLLVLFMK